MNGEPEDDDLARRLGKAIIQDAIKNSGFNTANFKQEKPLHIMWIVTPTVTYLVICALLLWSATKGTNFYKLIFIVGCLSAAWLASAAHKKANSTIITTIIGITAFVGVLLAGDVMTPEQTADKVEKILQEKKNGGEAK